MISGASQGLVHEKRFGHRCLRRVSYLYSPVTRFTYLIYNFCSFSNKHAELFSSFQDPVSVSVVHLNVPSEDILTTTAVPTLKSFYTTHQLSTWMLTSAPPTTSTVTVAVTVLPVTRAPWVPTGVETEEEKKRRFGFGRPPLAPQRELSTLERLNNEQPSPTDTVLEQVRTTKPLEVRFPLLPVDLKGGSRS